MSTPTTKEAIEYARKLTPDCWSDEVIKVLFLAVEEHLCRAEKAEAELATAKTECEKLKVATCIQCDGKGWYLDGDPERPYQQQCEACNGTGMTETYQGELTRRRAKKAERLWKEFITLMEITEKSDSGYAFNVNKISSCRAIDGKRLNEILNEARRIVF